MADVKISDLTDGGAIAAGDLVEIERPGSPAVSRKVALSPVAGQAAATFAEFNSATADKVLATGSVWGSTVALTDGATINANLNDGYDFKCTLGGNRTQAVPTNLREGKKGAFHYKATGSTRTLTLDAGIKLYAGVEAGPYSILTTEKLLVAYIVEDGVFEVTNVSRRTL